MAKIPQVLWEHINTAFPVHVCLVSMVLPNGFAQVSPKGSTMVWDAKTIAYWDRGGCTTHDHGQSRAQRHTLEIFRQWVVS